ncbi:hypothetical protein ACOMHN_002285 [Nucella lapillus]
MALIATRLSNVISRQPLLQSRCLLSVQQDRRRHKTVSRRRQNTRAKTFQQRLDEISEKAPQRNASVNIGFPLASRAPKEPDPRLKKKTRGKEELAARHRKLKLDLKTVQDKWLKEQGPQHIHSIVDHYGLYTHLFGSAFFYNTTPMSVCYDYDEAFVTPVRYGNRILPSEAAIAPFVSYESAADTLWTLVMTSPDGHLQCNDTECLHWMVSNIPDCDIHRGETLCEYLPPFPLRGTGYLRYAFILFHQQKRLDLSKSYRVSHSKSLSERSFSTASFYRKHGGDITPASICFFQSRWDSSVTSVFHNVLNMKEPSYDFIPPPDYHGEDRHYPETDSLEWYLDCYFGEDDTLEDWYTEALDSEVDSSSLVSPAPSWMKRRLKDLRCPEHQWKDLKPTT